MFFLKFLNCLSRKKEYLNMSKQLELYTYCMVFHWTLLSKWAFYHWQHQRASRINSCLTWTSVDEYINYWEDCVIYLVAGKGASTSFLFLTLITVHGQPYSIPITVGNLWPVEFSFFFIIIGFQTIVFIFIVISTIVISSGVCRTREPSRNFELRPLSNLRGSPVLIPLAITRLKC